jgi:hypothetical protein
MSGLRHPRCDLPADVIEKLQSGRPNARIDEILPDQWKTGLAR